MGAGLWSANLIYEITGAVGLAVPLRPNVLSNARTLDRLLASRCSLARFGDGEFTLIFGYALRFQERDPLLAKRLREILQSNHGGLLIGLPGVFSSLFGIRIAGRKYWREYLNKHRLKIYSLLDLQRQYASALVTRPYLENAAGADSAGKHFAKCKLLWQDRNIVLIEGAKSRVGVRNDLFSNARTVRRILCPATNAFRKYPAILQESARIERDALALIALGPTATVLAHDLHLLGYQALDIGHLDIEYEWFLRGAEKKIAIPHKHVNEVDYLPDDDLADVRYQSEIIISLA
jgi:glycosyltransferase family protein